MSAVAPARQAWRPGRRLRLVLLLAPALAVVVVLYGGGLALGLAQSFGYLPFIGQRTFSLDAYTGLVDDVAFRRSLGLTFRLALSATFLSAVLAVAAALLVRRTRRGRRLVTFLFQLNLPIPHIVGGTAMLLLLSQSGLVSRLAFAAGLTEGTADFPALTNDAVGWGIMAEYLWKEVPFIGIVVLAALQGGIDELEDVARTLGASAWQRFRHVTLPLVTPAVTSTSIIVFAFTFGSYEIPFLLGRPFPSVLPVLAYRQYANPDLNARGEAMAISMVIAVLVSCLVLVYMRLTDRALRGRR